MIQYKLLKYTPAFLRWYRLSITLDWQQLAEHLPRQGTILDVGCGIGILDYKIAKTAPDLHIIGIDINPQSLIRAQKYHKLQNIDYVCAWLNDIAGQFDCILFVDVFHHIPLQEHPDFLQRCVDLLAPGGYLLLKDIERHRGQMSLFMDRYISGCEQVFLRNCDEMTTTVSQFLDVRLSRVHFKAPFPHYYITACRKQR